jgi:hypothetical protein
MQRPTIKWFFIAVFLGALTGSGCLYWPASPRWRSPAGIGQVRDFSADSTVLVTVAIPGLNKPPCTEAEVFCWDVATGKISRQVKFEPSKAVQSLCVRPSLGGDVVLLGEDHGIPPLDPLFRGIWFVHDGRSGARCGGPIPEVAFVDAVSPDGKWFVGRRGALNAGSEVLTSSAVFSTQSGQSACELSDQQKRPLGLFAPDGATALLFSSPKEAFEEHTGLVAEIMELPAWRILKRCELPAIAKQCRFDFWDGRFLRGNVVRTEMGRRQTSHRCRIDLMREPITTATNIPISPDTSNVVPLDGEADLGLRAERVDLNEVAPQVNVWRQFLERLGAQSPNHGNLLRVQVVDNHTGVIRFSLPRPVHPSVLLSPDAESLVTTVENDGIEVWDTREPVRWPYAALANLLVSGGVLGLGAWKRREAPLPLVPHEGIGA